MNDGFIVTNNPNFLIKQFSHINILFINMLAKYDVCIDLSFP